MATQRTFAMLKPGALQRRIVGEILSRFEQKGLNIVALKVMSIPALVAPPTTPSTRVSRSTTT
jgi:nucleoside-diphosphate kinase